MKFGVQIFKIVLDFLILLLNVLIRCNLNYILICVFFVWKIRDNLSHVGIDRQEGNIKIGLREIDFNIVNQNSIQRHTYIKTSTIRIPEELLEHLNNFKLCKS
jgi:hypothetical protein